MLDSDKDYILLKIEQKRHHNLRYQDLHFMAKRFDGEYFDFICSQYELRKSFKLRDNFIESVIDQCKYQQNLKLSRMLIKKYINFKHQLKMKILIQSKIGYYSHKDNKINLGLELNRILEDLVKKEQYDNLNQYYAALEKDDPAFQGILSAELYFLNKKSIEPNSKRSVYNNAFSQILAIKKCLGSNSINIDQLVFVYHSLIKRLKNIEQMKNKVCINSDKYEIQMLKMKIEETLQVLEKHPNYSPAGMILRSIEDK